MYEKETESQKRIEYRTCLTIGQTAPGKATVALPLLLFAMGQVA
jgi:hypothetical protein